MSTLGRQELGYVDFSTVRRPKMVILGLVFTVYVLCTYALKYINFESTGLFRFLYVAMTQSDHTRSCFHRVCSMHVFSKIRQLWVDRGRVLWILVPFPWPKMIIQGLVFIVSVPCKYSVKYVQFGWTGAGIVDFSTVSMTESGHTRYCFHRLCSMNVCSKIRQL